VSSMPVHKYRPAPTVSLPDRTWPERVLERAPVWCSVDLRDGNQALIDPMDLERKQVLFDLLVRLGFREIEVAFPSASETDYRFVRRLIEEGRVPQDVTPQVLTPAREELIDTTLDAVRGARRAIVHLYNSTSELQRRVVFEQDRAGILEVAVRGARRIRERADAMPDTEVVLEYSPESFTGTELDFAVDIVEAVMDVWQPTPERRMIVNLPATVEMTTPNVYADRIEWFGRQVGRRDAIVLSVHPHNDRGTAVAAAELAVMAGADRVEGTLLGNGERTGNVDLVTLALNLMTQGVDPGLDLSDVNEIVRVFEHCNRLPVPPRQPYVGDLVFSAFSGSHQDAIRKGLRALRARPGGSPPLWEVPYLPVDPADLGRTYEAVIRVNGQSGKAGVAHVMEEQFGLRLPRRLQISLRQAVQRVADERSREIRPAELWRIFEQAYLEVDCPLALRDHQCWRRDGRVHLQATLVGEDGPVEVHGRGNGPVDAFTAALRGLGDAVRVSDYREHAVGAGSDARAAAYVEVQDDAGRAEHGVGLDADVESACLRAIVSAVNRLRQAAAAGSAEDAA